MKRKLFAYPDVLIVTVALISIGLLAMVYFWATGSVVIQVQRSLVLPVKENFSGFDTTGASKLDLRGLLGQPFSTPVSSASSSGSASPATSTQP